MKKVLILALFGIATAAFAQEESWEETEYSYSIGTRTEVVLAMTTLHAGSVSWSATVPCYLHTTGSATQAPPWRDLFTHLVNSDWTYSESWTAFFAAHTRVTTLQVYQWGEGVNSFLGSEYSLASRALDDRVVTDLYWEAEAI